jgi:hypothetical protein
MAPIAPISYSTFALLETSDTYYFSRVSKK